MLKPCARYIDHKHCSAPSRVLENTMNKFTYKIILSYRGTQYRGWQSQTTNPETVQNYIENVLANIVKHQEFQVIGASRTDTGVHASGQVLKVTLPREINPENLKRGMNSKLPSDIRVLECEFMDPDLDVNQDSTSKEYHYYFTINKSEDALLTESVYSYPEELDLELMQKACDALVGTHNFLGLSSPGPNPPSTHRKLLNCSIEKTRFLTVDKDIYYLKIQGTGFLKYMVRFLMGAIWDVGSKKLSVESLKKSLETGETLGVRAKAPSQGLHLINIKY